MSNVLVRQFVQGYPFSIRNVLKLAITSIKQQTINSIIPDATPNFQTSSQQFLQSLIKNSNTDLEFIKTVTTPALADKILQQVTQFQKQSFKISSQSYSEQQLRDFKINPQAKSEIRICPYVIFGQNMEERLKKQDPWHNLTRLVHLNRYFKQDESTDLSMRKYWQSVKTKQVYGFDVMYMNHMKYYEVKLLRGRESLISTGSRKFMISFETDSSDIDFWISDFNHIIKNKMIS